MFKVGDKVKVARDCYGNGSTRDWCNYCPRSGLTGIIVRLGKHGEDDAACIDAYHHGQGMIRCHQFEFVGE